jgi:hypothetical protein
MRGKSAEIAIFESRIWIPPVRTACDYQPHDHLKARAMTPAAATLQEVYIIDEVKCYRSSQAV